MRYVQELPDDEKITLLECRKNYKKSHVRDRSHAILLSAEGKDVSFIADLFKVRTRTVYEWFNRWKAYGIMGLMLKPGRGCKAKLNQVAVFQQQLIEETVKSNPQQLNKVAEVLSDILSVKITKYMLRSYLKKS